MEQLPLQQYIKQNINEINDNQAADLSTKTKRTPSIRIHILQQKSKGKTPIEQTANTATHSTKTKANTVNTLMHYLEPEDTGEWPWETHNHRPYRGAPRPCEITTGCHYRCLLCSLTQKGQNHINKVTFPQQKHFRVSQNICSYQNSAICPISKYLHTPNTSLCQFPLILPNTEILKCENCFLPYPQSQQ